MTQSTQSQVRVFQSSDPDMYRVYGRGKPNEMWRRDALQIIKSIDSMEAIERNKGNRELLGPERDAWLASHPAPTHTPHGTPQDGGSLAPLAPKAAHSMLPWSIQTYTNHYGFSVWSKLSGCVAERWEVNPTPERNAEISANGEFIVRACNSHYDLLAACEDVLDVMELTQVGASNNSDRIETRGAIQGSINVLRAAISKARGGGA